ncbi:MAG: membrane protein insertase YidC [Desulfamplus sp.]|nr:membrane protein insertase YidC [Desulfamplus sp.]
MDEQKRLIIAIILSVIVIVGWNFLFIEPVTVDQPPPGSSSQVSDSEKSGSDKTADIGVEDYYTDTKTGHSVPGDSLHGQTSHLPEPEHFEQISVSTPLYNVVISEKRAALTSLTLTQYREEAKENSPLKQMVAPELTSGLFTFDMEGRGIPGLDRAVFRADTDTLHHIIRDREQKISFSWSSPHGMVIEKIYTFYPSTYLIGMDIVVKNASTMPFKDALEITLPFAVTKEAKAAAGFAAYGPAFYVDGRLEEIVPDDIEETNTFRGTVEWAGNGDRYFISAVLPREPSDSAVKLSTKGSIVHTRYVQSMERLDPGKMVHFSFQCYMGPKSLKVLGSYDNNLKKAIYFGWFDLLAKPCLIAMNMIHDIIPNYGVAIIILTILIKLIFWPLGTKSYKSMNDMRKLQPLMMDIREKYKNDRQRMNQEVMSLYKTYKVNPMSGCLPLLVQMPIFFALYKMLYQAIELRHAPFMGWISDLSAPDRLFDLDVTIPFMQAPYGIPVLTIIMGASMFLQQKMSPTTGDPIQAKIMMLMPIFMTVIFINFPAGLVLYWLVNNVLSIGQQYYIQKKFS